MSRTLTWVSPTGVKHTVTVGGHKKDPWGCRSQGKRPMSEESLEHFMFLQRERLASRLQRMENRIYDARLDGMTRGQALTETSIERRG